MPDTIDKNEEASLLHSLATEGVNPATMGIDQMSPLEIAQAMNTEDAKVPLAVQQELPQIAKAIEAIADRLRQNGRLIYVGAGTSGRLGILDASECPPTFSTDPSQVVGIIAGGSRAITSAVEGAEDKVEAGEAVIEETQITANDAVVGIAASGRTPYVLGAMKAARERGAITIGVACNANATLATAVDIMIAPVVGPEVITGSTRLKAGTAQKLVLNMLSTGAMILLGKTFGNLMVDVRASNYKLEKRAAGLIQRIAGVDFKRAEELLQLANGETKTAIIMERMGVSASVARQKLAAHNGILRDALFQKSAIDQPDSQKSNAFPTPVHSSTTIKEHVNRSSLTLGIDGGGSKTLAVVVDADGQEVGRGLAGSANYMAVGLEQAIQNITSAVTIATQQLEKPISIQKAWLGLAGVDRPDDIALLTPHVQKLAQQVYLTNDAQLNLGALPEGIGVTLIAGTGSIALGRNQAGAIIRAGGWGHILGDEGSGYDLGCKALQAVVRAVDGRAPHTLLIDMILKNWQLQSVDGLLAQVYPESNNKSRIAKLADHIFAAAEKGDTIAHQIMQQGAQELALVVQTVSRKLGFHTNQPLALALGGGLLINVKSYRDQFLTYLHEKQTIGDIVFVDQPALSAARALQKDLSYQELSEKMLKR